jgi:hypothetical protein
MSRALDALTAPPRAEAVQLAERSAPIIPESEPLGAADLLEAFSPVATAARWYVTRFGWSVVPVDPRTKRPLVRWEAFQHRLPDPERLAEWLERHREAGIGIVTGAVSGRLVVLDLDEGHVEGVSGLRTLRERAFALPPGAPMVRTASGGLHVYLRWPDGLPLPGNFAGRLPGVDLRAEGGYVVAPPTTRPDGSGWRWEQEPDGPLPEPPGWLVGLAAEPASLGERPASLWAELLRGPIPEGRRNDSLTRLAGLLFRRLPPEAAWEVLRAVNEARCRPPLPEAELEALAASIAMREARRRREVVRRGS